MTARAAAVWLTAAEIARLGLPALPGDRRRILELADAESWADRTAHDGMPLARSRNARGGGIEYHVSVLPREAQERLLSRAAFEPIAANDTGQPDADTWAWYDAQPASIKRKAESRLAILNEIEGRNCANLSKTAAIDTAGKRHGVSASTINQWFTLVKDVPQVDWLPRLAPRFKGGGKEADIPAEAWQIFLTDYLRPEKPGLAACYNRVVEDYARSRGIVLPCMATFRRRLTREVSKPLKKLKRDGREALRRSVPPQQRSVHGMHALEAVNADGHTFDVFVRWEDGTVDRPVLVGVQDIAFRKVLAFQIDRSETTLLTRLAFANLFRDWGIPQHVFLDNGRAFASKALTGGQKTRFRFKIKDTDQLGMLSQLGCKVHWTLPYRGSSKPIERAWRDLCEEIAKHPALKGAYTGNKPDAKPENYREKAIPIAQFSELVAQRIAAHNARAGRRTEMADGGSFDDAFMASYRVTPIARATTAQLALALLDAEDRRCNRQSGSITLAGNVYWCPELIELAGEMVSVRYNPDDLHSHIQVYRRDGRFFSTVPVQEKTGFMDMAGAKRRAKLEKNLRRKVKEHEQAAGLLQDEKLNELLAGPVNPAPQPVPGVSRIVRHRGQTAAALKIFEQAQTVPAAPEFIDAFTAGVARLRPVE